MKPARFKQFGGPRSFNGPNGVAVDPSSGDVYVVDNGHSLVQKFTAAGGFVSQFGGPGSGSGTFNFPLVPLSCGHPRAREMGEY